jgi:predicted DNA-binding ribbon-helix-helix protein
MSDTLEILIKTPHMGYEEFSEQYKLNVWSSPSYFQEKIDVGGKIKKITSPLTNAEFEISAFIDRNSALVEGIIMKYNPPACFLGNNSFVDVLVYPSVKLALQLLKIHLKSSGVSQLAVDQLKIKNSKLLKLTTTYMAECEDEDDALMKREMVVNRIDNIFFNKNSMVRWIHGSKEDYSFYLNVRNYPLYSGYVKYKDIKYKNKRKLYDGDGRLDSEIKKKIYALSGRYLRIEGAVTAAYLEKHYPGMSKVVAWKNKVNSDKVVDGIFETFRSMLRLNDNLRHNKHRLCDLEKLSQKIQDFLEIYYVGNECKYLEKLTKNQRYELRKKILKDARIAINIPWKFHKKLKDMGWFVQPEKIKILKNHRKISPYVFNEENIPIICEKIKQVGNKMNNVKAHDGTSDISDLMEGNPVKKNNAIKSKTYRGLGSLKIPNISNMTDD